MNRPSRYTYKRTIKYSFLLGMSASGIALSLWHFSTGVDSTTEKAAALLERTPPPAEHEYSTTAQMIDEDSDFAIEGDSSYQHVETFIKEFSSKRQSNEEIEAIAGNLADAIGEDRLLLQSLLDHENLSQSQKNILLSALSYFATDDLISSALRDYALEKSGSSDHAEAIAGLELLSSMNIVVDAEVRKRLLEFGASSQDPGVLMRVMATLSSTPVADAEHQTIVEFFSEMTRSETGSVRALAMQRLAQWDSTGSTVGLLAPLSLNDQDSSVRAFSVHAIAGQSEIFPDQRAQLLAMIEDPQEDPMVKIAVAEVLDQFQLNENEVHIINDALVGEDFSVSQTP